MKTALSSVDVLVLSRELHELLSGARFDKAYSLAGDGLRIRFHLSGTGLKDVVILPNFLCVSGFEYPQTETPYNFPMVLRKHLEGLTLTKVEQHGFDRILEFSLEGNKGKFFLIVELFSTGNVILCDSEKGIIGILNRQHWKDRVLKPGEEYLYPPSGGNPLEIKREAFITLLQSSGKSLAATIASFGLGGFYAKEICLNAGPDKTVPAGSLNLQDAGTVYQAFKNLAGKVTSGDMSPAIVLDSAGNYIDVVPFSFVQYLEYGKKPFNSFNEAVDEYFSKLQESRISSNNGRGYAEALRKLEVMKAKQEEALARLKVEAVEHQKAGDVIYQHLKLIEGILEQIKKAKKQGLSDEEINKRFLEGKLKGIHEAKVFKKLEGSRLTLTLE